MKLQGRGSSIGDGNRLLDIGLPAAGRKTGEQIIYFDAVGAVVVPGVKRVGVGCGNGRCADCINGKLPGLAGGTIPKPLLIEYVLVVNGPPEHARLAGMFRWTIDNQN